MRKEVVAFKNTRYCYGEVCAVDAVSFSLLENTLTAVVGPNGGGKSTLIKLMAGIIKPSHGEVEFSDKKKIGYVSQIHGFDRMFPITVKQAVLTGTLNTKIKPFFKYSKSHILRAENALKLTGLIDYENRGIHQLSGGQMERAVIARAIASDADIIILDEPDSSLDIDAANELYEILKELKKSKTILVASHRIDKILDIADVAVYINKTVKIFDSPKELKKVFKAGMMI